MQFETRAIHAGQEPDPTTGAVVPPIYQTSTYKQDGVGGLRGGYEYSRSGNPTRTALEECLASLEGGRRGLAFASGLAAEDTLIRTLCGPGDHVVIPGDAYGGTYRLFAKVQERWGLDFTPSGGHDVDAFRAAMQPGRTKVIWVETPTNPLLGIVDIAAIAQLAHDAGALLVVDNTFASPYLQQPLALGADVVVHSTTKYMGGHSDVVGGALVLADSELGEQVAYNQNAMGSIAGPFDSWLVLRGIKTLGVRMDRHSANAERIVEMLTAHPKVAEVLYPGTAGSPRARHRGEADEVVRRHGVLPGRGRRGRGHRDLQPGRAVHPRRVARRRRVADRAPRPDDPRVGRRLAAGGAGRPGPALGGHRGRRRPARGPAPGPGVTSQVVCVDFGSTFTKAALVDLDAGALLATASSPTTIGSDVMDGYDVCRAALSVPASVPAVACSSAGGGLRLAVVGYERAITAEAGYRVALSAGARVVHVASDRLDDAAVAALLGGPARTWCCSSVGRMVATRRSCCTTRAGSRGLR